MAYPHNKRNKLWTQKTDDYHKHAVKLKKPHHKGSILYVSKQSKRANLQGHKQTPNVGFLGLRRVKRELTKRGKTRETGMMELSLL